MYQGPVAGNQTLIILNIQSFIPAVLEMSPSKSVARSVRISSGAKSVTNQEYIKSKKSPPLSTLLIWNYRSLLHNILLPNKNVPKIIHYLNEEDY